MEIKALHKVFFIGIGGIGMSALATYLLSNGCAVYGYDREESAITKKLVANGAVIQYDQDLRELKNFTKIDSDLVVYTPAVSLKNELLKYATASLNCIKRSELLAKVSEGIFTVAVAGTHGKTSTSALISHIVKSSGKKVCAFVGGIMRNYNSNVISDPNPEVMILEADEFDRSFLRLSPNVAVITSVDPDHLDVYETEAAFLENFKLFADRVSDTLFVHADVLKRTSFSKKPTTYEVKPEAVCVTDGLNHFKFDEVHYSIAMPGVYSANNAAAAIRVALQLGITEEAIHNALKTFTGVERRFNVYRTEKSIYIDDYAHHPTEISAAIEAARSFFSGKKLCVYFQPHLYTRTRDFMAGFTKSLSAADRVYVLPIYAAREEPIEGVTSELMLKGLLAPNTTISPEEFSAVLAGNNKAETVNLIMGAGSIGVWIKTFLEKEVEC